MTTEWIGYAGVIALALAWVPQSMETIRAGPLRCGAWISSPWRTGVRLAYVLRTSP